MSQIVLKNDNSHIINYLVTRINELLFNIVVKFDSITLENWLYLQIKGKHRDGYKDGTTN